MLKRQQGRDDGRAFGALLEFKIKGWVGLQTGLAVDKYG